MNTLYRFTKKFKIKPKPVIKQIDTCLQFYIKVKGIVDVDFETTDIVDSSVGNTKLIRRWSNFEHNDITKRNQNMIRKIKQNYIKIFYFSHFSFLIVKVIDVQLNN